MMLSTLLSGFTELSEDMNITGLVLDSREVVYGNVFVALSGASQHGMLHAQQAVMRGASAIIYDPAGEGRNLAAQIESIPTLAIDNLGMALGEIASRYYGHPSRQLDVIGITGTNGKTSCSHFLSQLLDHCAVIGTLGWGQRGALRETRNTTPDAISVQRMLSELLASGSRAVAMEVSSHALEQGRVNGIHFKGVVFTNVSRDHLDYHGTMEIYLQAKLTLLDKPGIQFAVVNLDDPYCDRVIARIPSSVSAWGISASGKQQSRLECISAERICQDEEGIRFDARWNGGAHAIKVPLYGDFNVDNVLSTVAVSLALAVPLDKIINRLHSIQAVPGRMDGLGGGLLPLVFVDYAHTPDALEKVLASVKKHCLGALWVVFGCGGNRDAGKRPEMGNIAVQGADRVIVTDDNPRFEESSDIINDIMRGCQSHTPEIIPDRAEAIQHAVLNAKAQDCIVIAGKGHETYQEIAGIRLPFDDKHVVMEALMKRKESL